MEITVVGRHMDVTDPIRQHAEQKIAKLDKYQDQVIRCDVTVSREASGKELFSAEVIFSVRNHPEIIGKAQGQDLYALIDEAVTKAGRQLHDFKERLKLEHR